MAQMCEQIDTALRWQLLPGLRGGGFDPKSLFERGDLRLAEWLRTGQGRAIKQGPHRAVFRVVLPGLDFIVKRYPLEKARSRVRTLFRAGPARWECDLALAVAARGVPTVEPLALGEPSPGADHGYSYLLLRTLAEVLPLSAFLEDKWHEIDPARRGMLRRRLANALGALLAQMHDAGFVHADLHPGNILLRLDAEDRPQLYLVDLQAVCLGQPLGWRASRANLALLNRWFMLRAGRADRLRFWHAYQGARQTPGWADGVGAGQGAPPDLVTQIAARQVEKHGLASNLAFWQRSDGRCLETNRYFREVRGPGVQGHVVADLDGETAATFLRDPDAPFQRSDVVVLKDSASSTVVEMDLRLQGGTRRVIYKRFAVTSWADPWLALLRRTPALRSWELGHTLRFRGLPTPRPLGVWHRYRGGLPREGYLLTEKVPGALDLGAFVTRLGQVPAPERSAILRGCIDQIARIIRDLHQRRLSHRDLKAANLLMSSAPWSLARSERERRQGSEPDAEVALDNAAALALAQAWFIDLVGVRRHGKLRRYRRVQNLARLNASFVNQPGLSKTDRLRFLRVYLRWGLRGRFGWKRWWRQIEKATAAKVRLNQQRGRPLG